MKARKFFSVLTPIFTLFSFLTLIFTLFLFLLSAASFAQQWREPDLHSSPVQPAVVVSTDDSNWQPTFNDANTLLEDCSECAEFCKPIGPLPPLHWSLSTYARDFDGPDLSECCVKELGYPMPPTATKTGFNGEKVIDFGEDFIAYEKSVNIAASYREMLGVIYCPYLEKEQELARRLAAVNARLKKRYGRTCNRFCETQGLNSLVEAYVVLRVAERVMKRHGEKDLAERFAIEAEWLRTWMVDVPGKPNGLVHAPILKWWRIVASMWKKNAVDVAGTFLIREKPFSTMAKNYTHGDVLTLKNEREWYGQLPDQSYPFDKFYAIDFIQPDPWLWLEFKLLPPCFFSSLRTEEAPLIPENPVRQKGLDRKIEQLIKELCE